MRVTPRGGEGASWGLKATADPSTSLRYAQDDSALMYEEINAERSRREESERDGLGHGFVTGRGWMQVISAVVGGQQMIGVLGIAKDGVEVDDCVEVA